LIEGSELNNIPVGYVPEARQIYLQDFVVENDIHSILEIGRQEGYGSTRFLATTGAEVWSVDISDDRFLNRSLLSLPNYHHIVSDSTDPKLLERLGDRKFDLIFLDSSHQYKETVYELKTYYPLTLKWFIVDEYTWLTTYHTAIQESGLEFQPIYSTKDCEGIINSEGRFFPGPKKGEYCFHGVKVQ